MYLKNKLMKAASICSYVFTGLWMVAAACCYALQDKLYYLFAAFALITLINGFVITDIRQKMTSAKLDRKQELRFCACTIVSILCLPAFVLNWVACARRTDDGSTVTVKPAAPKKEKPVKPLGKSARFITMCISLVLIFVFSCLAQMVETSCGTVKVSDFTLTKEMTQQYNNGEVNGKSFVMPNDTTYAVTMYVPETATAANPAPVVFVLPGFTRTKATMAQYCIELSRRGAVVFCSDPGGQGATTETSTTGANGVEYLVQYVYNNTDDFKFCDKNRFGAVGHSAGGGNVCTLASDMAGASYDESVIKAVYISGYIKVSSANRYAKLHSNAALSYAYYDEGAFRYQSDSSSFEVIGLRFLNEINGNANANSYDTIIYDYGYGDMADGTYRIIHREDINHCFEMYDPISIANTTQFFNDTLGMKSDIPAENQVWFFKELLNGLALASAFTFILSFCGVLMRLGFFAGMKENQKSVTEVPVRKAPQTVTHKAILWVCMIVTAVIACLDYIPLANLSIQIFPTGNSSSVFTFVFPARMINAILLWAVINGAIGLVIFFSTTLVEYAYEKISCKAKGIEMEPFDWGKFKGIKICGGKGGNAFVNTLKAIFLGVLMFGVFYLLVQICYRLFHQDFRFTMISASPLNSRMLVTALEYMPLIFLFYISNSIRVNCSIAREGWSEWKTVLVSALANSVGLMFILLINYVCYFTQGAPFYGYWGAGTEVWLYVNMVFALVVMMFLLPIFNRIFYKMTGNVWTGAIANCMIFIMMTISASVSYIPM